LNQLKGLKIKELASGPGKFTQSFKIDKKQDGIDITKGEEIYIVDENKKVKIRSSKRIGVKKDMKRNLRFFIDGNIFVSKK